MYADLLLLLKHDWLLIGETRAGVYKSRIRLLEFFRDYDRHNHGLVSEFQVLFKLILIWNMLKTICSSLLDSTDPHCPWKTPKWRSSCPLIKKTEDCSTASSAHPLIKVNAARVFQPEQKSEIMTVFTINHLESNPLAEVKPPSREWLVQGTNELSAVEEARLSEIITRLRSLIAERRLLLLPFFKDFDRVCLSCSK